MYLWNYSSPGRDGDFDNGVIAHEYAHGISNRLVGTSVSCLDNTEQMGEGWSDFLPMRVHGRQERTLPVPEVLVLMY